MTNTERTPPPRQAPLKKLLHEAKTLLREVLKKLRKWQYFDVLWLFADRFGWFPILLLVLIVFGFLNCNRLYHIGLGARPHDNANALPPSKDPPTNLPLSCPQPRISAKWVLHLRDAVEAYARELKNNKQVADYRVGYLRTADFPYRTREAEWSLKSTLYEISAEYGFLASSNEQQFVLLGQRNTPRSELSYRVPPAEKQDHLFTVVLVTSDKGPIAGDICDIVASTLR